MSYFSEMMANYFNGQAPGAVDPYAGMAMGSPADDIAPPMRRPPADTPLMQWKRYIEQNGLTGWPGDTTAAPPPPPPPIPGQADMPRQYGPVPMPVTPRFEQGDPTGARRTLARLADPQPIQPPPGVEGNVSDYIRLPVGGQPGSTPWTDGTLPTPAAGGVQPGAQPGLSNAPVGAQAAQPAPATRPAAQPTGSGIEGHIAEMRRNPLFQYAPPASQQPDFNDKLLRFGLAAMAAGGKPMATTLGALGEAGLSTVDASQKAKQTDFENTLNTRKLGVSAQKQISDAYEKVDMLRQRAEAATATAEDKRAYQAAQQDLQRWQIALTAQGRQDTNDTRQDANRIREDDVASRTADREDKTVDRRAAEGRRVDDLARQTQRDTDTHDRDLMKQQKDDVINNMGKTPAQLKMQRWGEMPPDSRQGKAYAEFQAKAPTLLDQARRAVASGRPRTAVNKQLQDLGYDPLPE